MNENAIMSSFEINKRYMFNEDVVLTYSLGCEQGATYDEFVKALNEMREDSNDDIEEIINHPIEIPSYKLADGREIKFILKTSTKEDNNMRWIIEWYDGIWTETEPARKKKKGFVHREVFYDVFDYTCRLRELEMDDEHSPIIVGTYECKIISNNPEEALL